MTEVTIRDKKKGRIEEFQETYGKKPIPHTDYYFRVRAANGKIIAQSEGYKTKASRAKGIRALVAVCTAYGLGGN
jgi:hypothetical protein